MTRGASTMLGRIVGPDSVSESAGNVCGVIDWGHGGALGGRTSRRDGTKPPRCRDTRAGSTWSWNPRRPGLLVCRRVQGHDWLCELFNDRELPINLCLVFFNPSQGCSQPHLRPSARHFQPLQGYQTLRPEQIPQLPRQHFHSFPLSSAQTASSPS